MYYFNLYIDVVIIYPPLLIAKFHSDIQVRFRNL